MEGRFGLRDLDLGRGETAPLGPLDEPAGEEGLPRPVLAASGLETGASGGRAIQLAVDGLLEALEPHGEDIEAATGHRAAPEGVDDLLPPLRADLLHGYPGDRLRARGT